jgi:hypothetical protein
LQTADKIDNYSIILLLLHAAGKVNRSRARAQHLLQQLRRKGHERSGSFKACFFICVECLFHYCHMHDLITVQRTGANRPELNTIPWVASALYWQCYVRSKATAFAGPALLVLIGHSWHAVVTGSCFWVQRLVTGLSC